MEIQKITVSDFFIAGFTALAGKKIIFALAPLTLKGLALTKRVIPILAKRVVTLSNAQFMMKFSLGAIVVLLFVNYLKDRNFELKGENPLSCLFKWSMNGINNFTEYILN